MQRTIKDVTRTFIREVVRSADAWLVEVLDIADARLDAKYGVSFVPKGAYCMPCGKRATRLYKCAGQRCDEHRVDGGIYTTLEYNLGHECTFQRVIVSK